MYLKNSAVPDFIALHEGSVQGEKTQPTNELFPQEKYSWFGHVTGKSLRIGPASYEADQSK